MKGPLEIIEQLSPSDAWSILNTLAKSDAQLAGRIAEMAIDRLSGVDPEEVAAILYDELDALEVEEVWDRAGKTRHGYVETNEAAYQMVEEVLEHYLEDLKKYQQLAMPLEARRLCMGLLAGLYRFEHESKSEFKDWAADAPISFADTVVREWKAGSPRQSDIAAVKKFIDEELGGWGAHLMQP